MIRFYGYLFALWDHFTPPFLRSAARSVSHLREYQKGLCPICPHTSIIAIILYQSILTSQLPDIFGVELHPFFFGTVKCKFRLPEILFLNAHQFGHNTVDGTCRLNFPAFNVLIVAEIIYIDFGSDKLKFPIAQQNEARLAFPEHLLQIFDGQLLQGIHDIVLNPLIHINLVEITLIELPISTSDLSIDRERRVRTIEFELARRHIHKFDAIEQLMCGGDELLKRLVLR